MTAIEIGAIVYAATALLLTWALCKASARGDALAEALEEALEEDWREAA